MKPQQRTDWDDPKWSNPRVTISSTGSFLDAEDGGE